MAIALQQGSVKRASFQKELDQKLLDHSEQLEEALLAPPADDSWKHWIQTIVDTGKKFFSHTKALHTTEETWRANPERWALLRRRQGLRQQLGATAARVDDHSQELWTALHFRIRELGRKLRASSRRAQAQVEEHMLAELQEAAQQGAKAMVHKFCVQLARNGSFISFAGRTEKVVGVTRGGGRDVCEDPHRRYGRCCHASRPPRPRI